MQWEDDRVRTWLVVGNLGIAAALVLLFVIPEVNHDPLPPEISFSQFGLGPNGWLFSLWAVMLAVGCLALYRACPVRSRLALVLLLIGAFGCIVMAIVRTDAGGAQTSVNAQIHTAASVLALFGLPYGCLAALWQFGRRWRQLGLVVTVVHTVGIALLLLAATGLDTAGLGQERSWAFWQLIAVLADHALGVALAVAVHLSYRAARASAASIQ